LKRSKAVFRIRKEAIAQQSHGSGYPEDGEKIRTWGKRKKKKLGIIGKKRPLADFAEEGRFL